MRSWMIAFATGIWLATFTPASLPFHPLWLTGLGVLLSFFRGTLKLTSAYLLGLGWCLLHLHSASEALLPVELENRDLWLQGTVSSLPESSEGSTRFLFKASALCSHDQLRDCIGEWQEWHARVRLSDYSGTPVVAAADRQFRVRLKRPRGFANPYTFDYEAWLWERGIRATGYVRENGPDPVYSLQGLGGLLLLAQAAVRNRFHSVLESRLPGGLKRQGILEGLTLGNRRGITDREWELFTMTGLTHLVVISGLHLGLVCWLGYRLGYFLWSCSCTFMMFVPAPRVAALTGLCCGLLYCLLAGFTLPATRALVMAGFVLSGHFFQRRHSLLDALFLALGLILLWTPMAVTSRGFWLSFTAVAVLLLAVGARVRKSDDELIDHNPKRGLLHSFLQHTRSHLRAQAVLLTGLLPFLLLFTGQISLLAPAVNLVAIPLVGMVVVPLALTGMALLFIAEMPAALCFLVADCLLEGFFSGLEWLAAVSPLTTLGFPQPRWWQLTVLLGAVTWLLWPASARCRWLALPLLLVILVRGQGPEQGQADIHVLDVGQGLAVLVETRHHLIIFDTGPAYSPAFNAGSGLLVPYIRGAGLPKPLFVVVSHGDTDHSGGLSGLLQHFPGLTVYSGEPERLPKAAQAVVCSPEQGWQIDGIGFAFIQAGTEAAGSAGNANDRSCVMRISSGDRQVLLPADIGRSIEQQLIRANPGKLRADVLLVPHHGSASSSSPGFINRVNPALAIVSNGYLNRYGHPAGKVVARYQNRRIRVLETAKSGGIRFRLTPEGIEQVSEWRIQSQRIWR